MKKFTKQEILELYGQVTLGEISFSRMVEIMNERVSEAEKPTYKKGDFLVKEYNDGVQYIFILDYIDDEGTIYYHCYYGEKYNTIRVVDGFGIGRVGDAYHKCLRYATDREKELLISWLYKVGKRWNAEKKCVEDIPVRKFKVGDKVRIKHGVSSKTHYKISPAFVEEMDKLIGKELIVENCSKGGFVKCDGYYFSEDWLEPYTDKLKKGDLAIFWDEDKEFAIIRRYYRSNNGVEYRRHQDTQGLYWANAIKFESIEQYERLIKGEI